MPNVHGGLCAASLLKSLHSAELTSREVPRARNLQSAMLGQSQQIRLLVSKVATCASSAGRLGAVTCQRSSTGSGPLPPAPHALRQRHLSYLSRLWGDLRDTIKEGVSKSDGIRASTEGQSGSSPAVVTGISHETKLQPEVAGSPRAENGPPDIAETPGAQGSLDSPAATSKSEKKDSLVQDRPELDKDKFDQEVEGKKQALLQAAALQKEDRDAETDSQGPTARSRGQRRGKGKPNAAAADSEKDDSSGRRRAQIRRKQEVMTDLLSVPGIGPSYQERLVQKGVESVAALKKEYVEKDREEGRMKEYLRDSVGIKVRKHVDSIITYLRKEEGTQGEESSRGTKEKKKLTFSVEGNISVGKTTFLRKIAAEVIELKNMVEIVPEPVDKWQDVRSESGEHFNILDEFYRNPQRYAYTFQNYVFVTRMLKERDTSSTPKALRLLERSVFSDRMVFVRAVHEAKWMSDLELSIYDSWFDPCVASTMPGLIPDGFIYLRANPDTCMNRMKMRARNEEVSIDINYLQSLHEKHEQWLFPSERLPGSRVTCKPWIQNAPDAIKDSVFLLEGDSIHKAIRHIPTLVLDCNTNIDLERDTAAKVAYANKVKTFFDFVQKSKEEGQGPLGSQPCQLYMPDQQLIMPDSPSMHHARERLQRAYA